MNIVYIFDDNYASISGVSIYSLLMKNEAVPTISIFIIDGGISESNKKKISNTVSYFNRNVYFIPNSNPEEIFGIKLDVASWCQTNYIRLYLEKIFPSEMERILYIDSDTLIRHNLEDLYNINMEKHPIAAVYDCYPLPKYQLGLGIDDEYYSDGILLINLKQLRQENTFDRFKKFLYDRNGKVAYLEQGAINYILRKSIKKISPKYNVMTLSLVYNKCANIFYTKDEPYYDIAEVKKAIDDPYIVHITGHPLCLRPWFKGANHKYTKEWRSVLSMSEWKDDFKYNKLNKNHSLIYRMGITVINILLRNSFFAKIIAMNSKRMKNLTNYR